MKEKYYITTAIAYASTKPHFGNTYEVIMSDAVARYKRLRGYDVFFCTGTDEHGQKIELKAADAGITPKEYVDNVAGLVRGVWDKMNTTYDYFIRTTDENHEEAIKHIFKKMYDKGDIYKGEYVGKYCTPNGVSLSDIGVTPDLEVDLEYEDYVALYYGTLEQAEDEQLQAALELLLTKIS